MKLKKWLPKANKGSFLHLVLSDSRDNCFTIQSLRGGSQPADIVLKSDKDACFVLTVDGLKDYFIKYPDAEGETIVSFEAWEELLAFLRLAKLVDKTYETSIGQKLDDLLTRLIKRHRLTKRVLRSYQEVTS